MQCLHGQFAERQAVSLIDQYIELTGIDGKVRTQVIDVAEYPLNLAHPRTGHGAGTIAFPEEGHAGEVIGVGMGIDHIVHTQILGIDVGGDLLGRRPAGAAILGIVVAHRIDDHGITAGVHHIGEGRGLLFEKMLDLHGVMFLLKVSRNQGLSAAAP